MKNIRSCREKTDVNIALYAYHLASNSDIDQAIIISGDNDLIPAIEFIKEVFSLTGVLAGLIVFLLTRNR
jgi:uncharacterized LabA/DUF88 family protein